MIHRLHMQNFKQHTDRVVEFGAGLNIIKGDNGIGKSNVLKAVLYALFGVDATGSPKEHLTTWGAQGGMLVVLDVTLPTIGNVSIKRSINKAEVWKDGKILASGQTPATHYIEDHLGMDRKLFASMLYAEQGDTQALLKMGPAGLQKQLEQVANVVVVDQVIAAVSRDETMNLGEIKGIGDIEDVNALRKDLDEAEANMKESAERIAAGKLQVDQCGKEITVIKVYHNDARNEKIRQVSLYSRLQSFQARRDLLTSQLHDHDANPIAKEMRPNVEGMHNKLIELENSIKAGNMALNNYNLAVAGYARTMRERDRMLEVAPFIEPVLKLGRELDQAMQALPLLQEKWHQAKLAVNSAVCPQCDRPFKNVDKDKLSEAMAIADDNYSKGKLAVKLADEAYKTFMDTNNLKMTEVMWVKDRLAEDVIPVEPTPPVLTKEVLMELDNQRAQANAALTHARTLETQYKLWVVQKEKLNKETAQTDAELEKAKAARVGLTPVSEELIQELADKISKAQEDKEKAVAKLNEHTYLHADQNTYASALFNRIAAAEDRQSRINKLQADTALLSDLQKYLRSNRSKFMGDTWASLTNYTTQLITTTTEGLFTNLTRTDAGAFFIDKDGRSMPVAECSGAEKSIIGLCLRISLARVFYGNSGFTLLDESTADCKEDNAARVAGMLRGLQSQVIMVTHREGDSANASHNIYLTGE